MSKEEALRLEFDVYIAMVEKLRREEEAAAEEKRAQTEA